MSNDQAPAAERHPRLRQTTPDMRTCAVCGQRYDLRDLEQAYHHTEAPHAGEPSGSGDTEVTRSRV